jgi:hypothetical protein
MGTFKCSVGSFDILAVIAIDKGVVGIFTDELDEGIEFGFGEFFLVFHNEEILIPEE